MRADGDADGRAQPDARVPHSVKRRRQAFAVSGISAQGKEDKFFLAAEVVVERRWGQVAHPRKPLDRQPAVATRLELGPYPLPQICTAFELVLRRPAARAGADERHWMHCELMPNQLRTGFRTLRRCPRPSDAAESKLSGNPPNTRVFALWEGGRE